MDIFYQTIELDGFFNESKKYDIYRKNEKIKNGQKVPSLKNGLKPHLKVVIWEDVGLRIFVSWQLFLPARNRSHRIHSPFQLPHCHLNTR